MDQREDKEFGEVFKGLKQEIAERILTEMVEEVILILN